MTRPQSEDKRCQKNQKELEQEDTNYLRANCLTPIISHSFHVHNNSYLEGTFINPHVSWSTPILDPFALILKGDIWCYFLLSVWF